MADATTLETAVVPNVTPSPAGHDEAMAAKFDAAQAAARTAERPLATEVPQRPAHIPEKFWDAAKGEVRVEDMAKSYAELEKGKPAAVADPTKPAAVTPPVTPDAAVAAVGADAVATFSAEFAEKGQLSEDSYKALETKGIPKAYVDAYIAGQQALVTQQMAEVLTPAGGKDGWAKVSEWASKTMDEAALATLNKQLTSKDLDTVKTAVVATKARYDAAYGTSQAGLIDGTGAPGNVTGYASRAEMSADMRNPKYASDPAFRRSVEAKLSVTTAF